MAMRFRRSMKIAPGLRINLGKRGLSLTAGGKLGRVTVGPSGTHVGSSIPGTGIYMTQKVGSSQRSSAPRSRPSQPAAQQQAGTLRSLVRGVPPKESGTSGLVAMLSGSEKRKALQAISRAAAAPSAEADGIVSAAVAQSSDSWTVRREAGLYFLQRGDPATAVSHLAEAANRFLGNRTLYYLLAADTAVDAGNYAYAVAALEPYVAEADPDSDIGALVLTTIANASLKAGDASRSLELLTRLPLRKQNLGDTLLYALCVRACANRATGKKAQAKKDIDRVYAHRPDFPMLGEATKEVLAD
jgi:tetratricopeptide (TPR) repeat protein